MHIYIHTHNQIWLYMMLYILYIYIYTHTSIFETSTVSARYLTVPHQDLSGGHGRWAPEGVSMRGSALARDSTRGQGWAVGKHMSLWWAFEAWTYGYTYINRYITYVYIYIYITYKQPYHPRFCWILLLLPWDTHKKTGEIVQWLWSTPGGVDVAMSEPIYVGSCWVMWDL